MIEQLERPTPTRPAPAETRLAPARSNAGRSAITGLGRLLWRRTPYTVLVVALMLATGLATGTLWGAAGDQPWFGSVGYGLPSLAAGQWWTPISGAFLALNPWFYLPMAGGFAVLVGYTDCRIGTRLAVLVTVGGHCSRLPPACCCCSRWATPAGIGPRP